MYLRIGIVFVLIAAGFQSFSQNTDLSDSLKVEKMLEEAKALIGTDSLKSITISRQAIGLAKTIKYYKGEANGLKNIGMVYYMKGKYVETLDYWNQSLEAFQKVSDNVGVSNMLNNIGAIYFNQGADDKALEYSLKSLQLAEKINDTLRMVSALINVGSIYHNKKDPVALNYLLKVIPMVEASGNTEAYVVVTGDVGEIYYDANDDKNALEYFNKSVNAAGTDFSSAFSVNGIGKIYLREEEYPLALSSHEKAYKIAEKFDDKLQLIRSLRGTADVYIKQRKLVIALEYYNQALTIAENMDDVNIELKDLYQEMASAYSLNRDYTNAYQFQTKYANIKDTLYNIESKKRLNQLQFDFELSKKEGEISLQQAKIQSEKQARTATTIGLGLILVIAIIIYRNYLQKSKTNSILDKQNDEIETLLLNILPKEVAEELKENGTSVPKQYEEVSVLFTDFFGFTKIADNMAPNELVSELNQCFMAFDIIVEKYGLEKIKTIGDSYLCAGNIPSANTDHAYKIIKAGLEMLAFLEKNNKRWEEKNMMGWEIRIGVHVGPVVAGVVGKTKYAYDIWGSTVNIASRMETNGTPGRVNISARTYEMVKDRFECNYRGKVHAKNMGDVDMYFIESEKV